MASAQGQGPQAVGPAEAGRVQVERQRAAPHFCSVPAPAALLIIKGSLGSETRWDLSSLTHNLLNFLGKKGPDNKERV